MNTVRSLCICFLGLIPSIASAEPFDHAATSFPLLGLHRFVDCEACHRGGVFTGTPRTCEFCHGDLSAISASTMPPNHIRSSNRCAECHTENGWNQVRRVEHFEVRGDCASCHNGVTSEGKPPNHVVTTLSCDSCHGSDAWVPAVFDHMDITAPCSNCHDGTQAQGKPATHVVTTAECDTCHSTVAWTPARFDHDQVTSPCSSCHNGTNATGKRTSHFVTSDECDQCHTTTAWSPTFYAHQSAAYPGQHRSPLGCDDCHTSNSQIVPWPFPAYQPDCAACHAQQYRSGEHRKAPGVQYTVSELRDCSGSCHVYTDSSFTTIESMRSNEHKVSDRSFD